jgi:hypothetical protein
MIDAKYLAWIHADQDGELAGAERAELNRYLLANPEARVVRDELARLCRALDAVGQDDPPAGFRDALLAALPSAPARCDEPRRFHADTRLRFAAAFAGGLLVSALAFTLAGDPGRDGMQVSQLVGTVARDGAGKSAGLAQDPVDGATMHHGQATAQVSLHGTPDAPVIGVAVSTHEPLEVVASVGEQRIRFTGFTSSEAPDARVAAFGRIAGDSTLTVSLVDPASGSVLQRVTLSFEAPH